MKRSSQSTIGRKEGEFEDGNPQSTIREGGNREGLGLGLGSETR